MPPRIFISAGEASGEHYGALLIEALQRRLAAQGQSGEFFGMGGQRMAAAGLDAVVRSEEMAVMGLTEVLAHLPRIYSRFRRLKKAIRERRPQLAVLIDFPEVHLRIARQLHRLGVPVLYFVSPQLWAWKRGRIRLVRKYVDRMLVIFPFEESFYRGHGVEAEFVGHPLAELAPPAISREKFAEENGLDGDKTWIALLPGSRLREIQDHLPTMLEAARGMAHLLRQPFAPQSKSQSVSQRPTLQPDGMPALQGVQPAAPGLNLSGSNLEFLIPLAPTLDDSQRRQVRRTAERLGNGLRVRLVDDARAALRFARASVVASGTATVEAALAGNPFVVVYRVSPVTWAIAKRVVKVPHVAMANLIAGWRVAPELIQNDFTAAKIIEHLKPLLPDGTPRQSMMKELVAIREALQRQPSGKASDGQGAIERVAAVAMEVLRTAPITPAGGDASRSVRD
jgi:lipid-A-disaccharide synthase